MKFRRIEKVVEAEPMTGVDFLLQSERHKIAGGKLTDTRAGFKIVDKDGAVSWMPAEEFHKEFVEVNDGNEA